MSRAYLFLPFAAAFGFALSTLFFKRAFKEGAGTLVVFMVTNATLGVVFLPMLAFGPTPFPWDRWHHPVLAGLLFFAGHFCNFAALRIGDISLITPVMGTKVIFVALLSSWAFGITLSLGDMSAAALAGAGVVLMGVTDIRPGRKAGVTTLLALGSALAFALCDILIQQWAAPFGVWGFVPLLFATVGLGGLALIPWVRPGRADLPPGSRRWLGVAVGLTAVQAILISLSIGIWKDATGVNVVYGLRGLWGIGLVWMIGHWFGNDERRDAGRKRMAYRLVSALLLLSGVILTVVF